MSRGSFKAGLEAMGAFESGKPSGDPEQYRVQNTLGFTGKYQFGEALLIDLGYYEADTFYGAGAATNLWQGTWTGKAQAFGVNDIEDFRNSPEIQEAAIRDAFEFNWDIIERNLGNAGKDIDDFIGETISFDDGGTQKSVTITPFGILAGAHLRGPYGLSNLLLNGQVSRDEYGTSILRYVDEYAGYDVPEDITGGSVSNPPIDVPDNPTEPVDPVDPGSGNPPSQGSLIGTDGVEDVFDFTWEWGQNAEIAQFNPQEDTINLKLFWLPDSQQVSISDDSNGNATIDLTEVNNQTITLEGVSKSELTASNFEGLPDASTVLGNYGEPNSPNYEDADRLSFQAGGSPTIRESEMDNLMVSQGYDLNILGNSGDTNTNLPTDGDDLIEISSGFGSGNGLDYKSGTDNLFFEDEEFAVLGNAPSYASDASEYPIT